MSHQFLKVLMQVLIQKSHDLLQEEIVISIYNMAAVDFDAFFTDFLPHFLASIEGIDNSQKAVLAKNFKIDRVSTVTTHYVTFLLVHASVIKKEFSPLSFCTT